MEINGELVNEEVRYADLGLSQALMQAIQKKGYVQATPVRTSAYQSKALHSARTRLRW